MKLLRITQLIINIYSYWTKFYYTYNVCIIGIGVAVVLMLVRQKKARVKIFNYYITGRHLWACSYVPHADWLTKKHTNGLAHASSRFIQTYDSTMYCDSSKYWSGECLTCRTASASYTYDRCMLFSDTNKCITLSIKMILRIIVKNHQC